MRKRPITFKQFTQVFYQQGAQYVPVMLEGPEAPYDFFIIDSVNGMITIANDRLCGYLTSWLKYEEVSVNLKSHVATGFELAEKQVKKDEFLASCQNKEIDYFVIEL